ncbi:hypothetical protein ABW21_db0202644 [Orbilia brochopaga]|nr:hypothetical protein ABW21_db0202644 [Drechslerella brochopaga]
MRLRQHGVCATYTGLLALLSQTNPVLGATKVVTAGFLNNFANDHPVALAALQGVLARVTGEAWFNYPIGDIDEHREEQLEAINAGRVFDANRLGVPLEQIPVPPFYTELNTALETSLYNLVDDVEDVDYSAVSFQPEAQRISEGFNLRLLNDEARKETTRAIDDLIQLNDNIYMDGEWDVNAPGEFFSLDQHLREDEDIETQPFIHMLDNLVYVLVDTWILPPGQQDVIDYVWNAVDNGQFRGHATFRINPDGPKQLADGLGPLYQAIYGYRSSFESAMRRVFKFLPRELPVITEAYRRATAALEFLRFYENLVDDFFTAVNSMVPPPSDDLELPLAIPQ